MRGSALIRGIVLAAGLLSANDSLWSQKAEGWEATEAGSSRSGGTLAAASTGGQYSAGQQRGRSEFVVSCQKGRLFCFDCRFPNRREVSEYQFTWIIPSVPDFYFELLGQAVGSGHELASLAVGTNPPTPRHVTESVTKDGRWEFGFSGQRQDVDELLRGSGKATFIVHEVNASGMITVETQIPPLEPALQAVLDACSDATFEFAGDRTTCPNRAGEELVNVKVCTFFFHDCIEPEMIGGQAVWRLTQPDHEKPGKQREYRLACAYKKAGGANEAGGGHLAFVLSQKLTECDETLKPMSVSCK